MKNEKNKYGRYVICMAGAIIGFILCCFLLVYIMDPLFIFHKSWFDSDVCLYNEDYQNIGMAENFDYDTVIMGSSMAENFKCSWFNEKYKCRAVKLTQSGGSAKNFGILLERVFGGSREREIKRVFYGLDISSFLKNREETRNPIPSWVSGDRPFQRIGYILNKDVIWDSLIRIYRIYSGQSIDNTDDAYSWGETAVFSAENAMESLEKEEKGKFWLDIPESFNTVEENVRHNLIPYIEANPDTEFNIFFPPYSILYWGAYFREGYLEELMRIEKSVVGELLDYENVKLFYFQDDYDIIGKLDNYKDYSHYSPAVNQLMLNEMYKNNGKYRLHKQGYETRIDSFERGIREFKK